MDTRVSLYVCAIINQAFRFNTLKGRTFVLLFSLFSLVLSPCRLFFTWYLVLKIQILKDPLKFKVCETFDMSVPQANYNGFSRRVFFGSDFRVALAMLTAQE